MREKLYILPFDHRTSFIKMLGFGRENLSPGDIKIVKDRKHLIYEGFLKALKMGVAKTSSAILIDEEFGAEIQEEARADRITRLLTVEKSGQEEFDLEYGQDFGEHIEKFKPEYVKALLRYNSAGDKELNLRQIEKLKILNDFCRANDFDFLVELLVLPTPHELAECGNNIEEYDNTMRWHMMVSSIKELQKAGIEPKVWKLEGLEHPSQMKVVVNQCRSRGRKNVGIIILGRDESEGIVEKWLATGAKIPGVIGFAIGRTLFKQPVLDFHSGKISRADAALQIARNFKNFADLFEKSRAS